MPRTPAPIPPITAVPREQLTVEDVRCIIEVAEQFQARRKELAREIEAALNAGDTERVSVLARQLVGLEKKVKEQ
jgi:hypothetical protein